VQALVAVGRNPDRQRRNGARSPVAYLRSLTTPSGKVRYSRTSTQTPVWVTAQALAALARKPFPLAPVLRARKAAPAPKPAPTPAPAAPAKKQPAPKPRKPRARSADSFGVATPELALDPTLQKTARAAGWLTAALFAPIT
jgi:hypothetical protein